MVSKIVVATSGQTCLQDEELFARIDLAWQNSSRNPSNDKVQVNSSARRGVSEGSAAPRQPVKRKCNDAADARASAGRHLETSPRFGTSEAGKAKKMRQETAARSEGERRHQLVQARPVSVIDVVTLSQEELGHTCEFAGWTPPSPQPTFDATGDRTAHIDQCGWDADDDFDDDLDDGFIAADECENLFLSLEKVWISKTTAK